MTNTFFRKRNSQLAQLLTYNSGGCETKVDYILLRQTELKLVKNAKVIGNEECTHNTKYLLWCSSFKLPQRRQILLLQSKSYGDCESQKDRLNTKISLNCVVHADVTPS